MLMPICAPPVVRDNPADRDTHWGGRPKKSVRGATSPSDLGQTLGRCSFNASRHILGTSCAGFQVAVEATP